ncbi:hypothetical protein [Hymenobacter sp. HDW8]|uniref:hypothetical protein n=1 Tax=Hymenobacter sp. HDW8 TaxID=2714932 RepID=UPI00140A402E|nr:hypothetical protein [Hymenobacter sp. HDW8]QIL76188.1 hypothetical protein G7064_10215 [Hymenobacter sp. HDW8]
MSLSLRNLTRKLPLGAALSLDLLLLVCNSLNGHYNAPAGILYTPIVVPLVVWLIAFSRNRNPILKAVLSGCLISLHDISIKLYGGGMHDPQGQGVVHLFLFIALLPSFLILVAAVDQDGSTKPKVRRVAKLLFVVLVGIHLVVTSDLGAGQCINC